MHQTDLTMMLPYEIPLASKDISIFKLPRSVDSVIDSYLLNSWLQIKFLHYKANIINPHGNISEVNQHVERAETLY